MGTGAEDTSDLLFEALTPLGFRVRVRRAYWEVITTIKHPAMVGREDDVKATLERPVVVRQSRSDPEVYLFYRMERAGRWTCVVARKGNGEGSMVTAYPTDAIKEGVRIWPK